MALLGEIDMSRDLLKQCLKRRKLVNDSPVIFFSMEKTEAYKLEMRVESRLS